MESKANLKLSLGTEIKNMPIPSSRQTDRNVARNKLSALANSTEEVGRPSDSTYQPGIDVCEALDLTVLESIPNTDESVEIDILIDDAPPSTPNTELQEYTEEDVIRFESRRPMGNSNLSRIFGPSEPQIRTPSNEERIETLRQTQYRLKGELEAAKNRLMIDKSRWSYECKELMYKKFLNIFICFASISIFFNS